ncbi:MAG: SoxR reducing system RseC family protein [Eubacteriales bacterium]|nr:SoxR reducing system RseC family protein [Eubacteriales bacterium]
MIEYGEVVDIKEDMARVRFRRTSACGRCKACGMLSGQNEIVVEVPNELNATVGDYVAVSIKMQKALRASAIAYVFPLFMLIAGVFTGWLLSGVWHIFANQDAAMAVSAIIFVLLSFLLLKIASPIYNKTVGNVYTMVRRKKKDESVV